MTYFANRKSEDYVYGKWEYVSTGQKYKSHLRLESKANKK